MKLWHGQKYFADSVLQVTTTTSSSGIQSYSFVENTQQIQAVVSGGSDTSQMPVSDPFETLAELAHTHTHTHTHTSTV